MHGPWRTALVVGASSGIGAAVARQLAEHGCRVALVARREAGLDAYLEAIRNRIGRHGVAVVTVKPGPVDTPMTEHIDRKPFLISAEEAARQTLAAAARRARIAYVPRKWRPIMLVVRHIPSPLFQRLDL